MNNVNLIGRFGKDPETVTRKGSNGDFESLMSSIAVNSNDKKDESYWIDIHAMGKTAENIAKYFKKGDRIGISGELTNYKDKNGITRYSVKVNNFDFIEKKEGN